MEKNVIPKKTIELNISECFWEEVEDTVKTCEPELHSIISKLSPDEKFPILKVIYPFGVKIFEKGVFYLPTVDRKVIAITDENVPAKIKQQLGYNSLPLGVPLNHGVEVYAELEDRVFSLAYFNTGLSLGVWETFAPASPFSVSAGARSIFMLPKITNAEGHRRLGKYDVGFPAPLKTFDQYAVFAKIANHKNFAQPWTCEVLFFTLVWMRKIREDSKWKDFQNFLFRRIWQHANYSRNKMFLDIMWENFSRFLTKKRIKPNTHLVDTVKHLIFVAVGILPAFSPATDNQAAPIDGLLKVYLDEYGLKTHAPTMMQPHHFSLKKSNDCVYYSMQVPAYLESIPQFRLSTSTRTDLSELIALMDLFTRELLNFNLHREDVPNIYENLRNIQFDYFHSESNVDNGIYSSIDLAAEDKKLLYMPKGYTVRPFCEKSSFARGCIKISNKFTKT